MEKNTNIVDAFISYRADDLSLGKVEEFYEFAAKQNIINKHLFNNRYLDGNDTKRFSADSIKLLEVTLDVFDVVLSTNPENYEKREILDTFVDLQQAETLADEYKAFESLIIDVSQQALNGYYSARRLKDDMLEFFTTISPTTKLTRKISKVGAYLNSVERDNYHLTPQEFNKFTSVFNEMYLLYTNFLGTLKVNREMAKEIIITTNFEAMLTAGEVGNISTCLASDGCNRGLTGLYASMSNVGVAYLVKQGDNIDNAIARSFVYLGEDGFAIGEMYPRYYSAFKTELIRILSLGEQQVERRFKEDRFTRELLGSTSTYIIYNTSNVFHTEVEYLCMSCGAILTTDDLQVFNHWNAEGEKIFCQECLDYEEEDDEEEW